jgi:hypothetical protein
MAMTIWDENDRPHENREAEITELDQMVRELMRRARHRRASFETVYEQLWADSERQQELSTSSTH